MQKIDVLEIALDWWNERGKPFFSQWDLFIGSFRVLRCF